MLEEILQRTLTNHQQQKGKHGRMFGNDITNLPKQQHKVSQIMITSKIQNKVELITNQYQISSSKYRQIICYERDIINCFMVDNISSDSIASREITIKMRAILIDWLVDVHMKLNLRTQTFYLCIRILDEYCGCEQNIARYQLQGIGITCLWMASKFQQIYPPKLKSFISTIDRSSCNQTFMKQTQQKILSTLKFQMVRTTPYHYISMVLQKFQLQSSIGSLCMYLIDISILQNLTSQFSLNIIVLSSVQLSRQILKQPIHFQKFKKLLQVTDKQIMTCSQQIKKHLNKSSWTQLTALRRKYSSSKYHYIGRIEL